MIAAKLRAIPGVKLAEPQGAFYVLPEMSAFFGPGAEAKDFGPVPDSDTFCMYLMQKAHVSVDGPDALMLCHCMISLTWVMGPALNCCRAAMLSRSASA